MQQSNPPHPGIIIKRVYIEPNGLCSVDVAKMLQMSPNSFGRLISGKLIVSAAMALKLSKILGRSPESWLAMQRNFDLWRERCDINLQSPALTQPISVEDAE